MRGSRGPQPNGCSEPYLRARIEPVPEPTERDETISARTQALVDLVRRLGELAPHLSEEVYVQVLNTEHPGAVADMVASLLDLSMDERQRVLETIDLTERLRYVTMLCTREIERYELTRRMQEDAREELTQAQREYFLRQQLKAIQKELGEAEEERPDLKELRERLAEAQLTEEAREAAEREMKRLRHGPAAAERNVARTYVEWLLDVHWLVGSETKIDIPAAQHVLDEDHYDLDDVKDRIIEYLAVRRLRPEAKGPILCFVGPPGVGKTSLGRSIARATGRKFHRISLGGVRDEAEIRGHRRTYVGALPGRIVQGLRRVGVNNPVFMLDEIDKLGSDFRGDPSSALLEVLDPEQTTVSATFTGVHWTPMGHVVPPVRSRPFHRRFSTAAGHPHRYAKKAAHRQAFPGPRSVNRPDRRRFQVSTRRWAAHRGLHAAVAHLERQMRRGANSAGDQWSRHILGLQPQELNRFLHSVETRSRRAWSGLAWTQANV